jgi:hypothetical protein
MGVVWPVGEFQSVLRWSLTGDPEEMVCTLGVRHASETDPSTVAQDIYDAATASASITSLAALNQGWTFVGVTCYLQDDPGQIIGTYNNPITATVGGLLTLPQNNSFLIHKVTGSSGRQNKGRMYLPPYVLGEGDVSVGGVIGSGVYTTIQGRWNQFEGNLSTAGITPVLFHSLGGPSTPITSFLLDPVIATQRRRLRN